MRIDIKNIKSQKNIIILAVCFIIIISSGVVTYKLLLTGNDKIYKAEVTSPRSTTQVAEQTLTTGATTEVVMSSEPAQELIIEKDPFKEKFLERFLKAQKKKLQDSVVLTDAPNIEELPKIVLPHELPTIEPQETKKDFPKINILGIYRINDKNIALTDKGELREGMFVEQYKVSLITNNSVILDGVDNPYFLTGKKE